MPRAPRIATSPAGYRRWVATLALLLVLGQTLGFVHGVAHAPGAPLDASTPLADRALDLAGNWVQGLFTDHDEGKDCPLFDSLTQSAGPAAARLVLALQAAYGPLAVDHGDLVARWAALFDARGPPAFR